jgi:CubicO group peptidase (beta-lactamase class C family)
MLQQDAPDDYVIATGEQHSVRELCEQAFSRVGIEIEWQGSGLQEQGMVKNLNPLYGKPTVKTGEPVKDDTVFEAASLTKPFFAFLAMKFVEDGKLDLDKPLVTYAPEDYIVQTTSGIL